MNNQEFENIIKRANKVELFEAFYTLSNNITKVFDFKITTIPLETIISEGVAICFEKLHRFNPDNGRAFNFFTTVVLCHYRQLCRTAKNYNKLKVRYREHLKNYVIKNTNAVE